MVLNWLNVETWELFNLFFGTKIFNYHICYQVLRPFTTSYNWKNKMLAKKNKWVNDGGKFTQGFKNWREIWRKLYQNLDDFTNLLIKLAVKARVKKARYTRWNDISNYIPNYTDTWKSDSSLYPVITEDHFQTRH